MAVSRLQGLKLSGTVPDLRRAAFACEKKEEKDSLTLKKNIYEFDYQ